MKTEANKGTSMTKDEALKLALEAFKEINYDQAYATEIAAIKQALAQPEQEPVAFYVYKPTLPRGHLGNVSDGHLPWVYDQDPSSGYSARMLVYTTPPHRKPLTDEEIGRIAGDSLDAWSCARAIEAAHGIKENT